MKGEQRRRRILLAVLLAGRKTQLAKGFECSGTTDELRMYVNG